MLKFVHEIFEEASQITSGEERAQYLRDQFGPLIHVLESIVVNTFMIEWKLPEGKPPYTPSPFEEPGNMYRESKKFYIWSDHRIDEKRREKLFIETLEYLPPKDALILLAMKENKLPYPRLTENFFRRYFSEWFTPEGQ